MVWRDGRLMGSASWLMPKLRFLYSYHGISSIMSSRTRAYNPTRSYGMKQRCCTFKCLFCFFRVIYILSGQPAPVSPSSADCAPAEGMIRPAGHVTT